jgi:hypothetical protein
MKELRRQHQGSPYYNRKWEPVGNDAAQAVRLLMKKRGELLTVRPRRHHRGKEVGR